ncbi:MAG: hypothetical protein WAN51_05105 [Alphaproteobacteria bacterium]
MLRRKSLGPLGCALAGARGVAPFGRCPASPFARFGAQTFASKAGLGAPGGSPHQKRNAADSN